MAKEKFNMQNLVLPSRPAVLKHSTPSHDVAERAVETIHGQKDLNDLGVSTKKISFDLPADKYKAIKLYCLERDISMREYLMGLIYADSRV